MAELGRLDVAVEYGVPSREIGQPLEIRPEQQPIFFGSALGQAIGDSLIVEPVE